jgi:hypothetical protein
MANRGFAYPRRGLGASDGNRSGHVGTISRRPQRAGARHSGVPGPWKSAKQDIRRGQTCAVRWCGRGIGSRRGTGVDVHLAGYMLMLQVRWLLRESPRSPARWKPDGGHAGIGDFPYLPSHARILGFKAGALVVWGRDGKQIVPGNRSIPGPGTEFVFCSPGRSRCVGY